MKTRCAKIFAASKDISVLYVSGNKIFMNFGAAQSYHAKVEEVSRSEMSEVGKEPDGSGKKADEVKKGVES